MQSEVSAHRRPFRLGFERQIIVYGWLAGLPGSTIALGWIWYGDYLLSTRITITVLIAGFWLVVPFILRNRIAFSLQTLANLLAAYREGDFSIRVRRGRSDDSLGALILEANSLGAELREQRLKALDAVNLLRKVMEEIEVAIFTFDADDRLALVNRMGERILGQPAERLLGRSAVELGLAECLDGEPSRTLDKAFPAKMGRWGMRRTSFREKGVPHQLVVLTDLSLTLREEERQAWKRLLRVLGHELNNSMAPIKSSASTLQSILGKDPLPPDWREDVRRGLALISSRSDSLLRFMQAYSSLARLPQPEPRVVPVGELVRRVAGLFEGKIQVSPADEISIEADPDQLEQLLMNIFRNAVEASGPNEGVRVEWKGTQAAVEIQVWDEGPGLSGSGNLFVPFFTTKPGGTGIGLALSRQIAEAHGGTVLLENRPDRSGCVARVLLPLHTVKRP